jgi:hypothetical protein
MIGAAELWTLRPQTLAFESDALKTPATLESPLNVTFRCWSWPKRFAGAGCCARSLPYWS